MIKNILKSIGISLALILAFMGYRSFNFSSKQLQVKPLKAIEIGDSVLQHFQTAIQFPTISYEQGKPIDTAAFEGFQQFTQRTYPLIHRDLNPERVNKFSTLYSWKGEEASRKPVILIGHIDVVPIEESSRSKWKADPFGAKVIQDTIWGRGTVDDKVTVIGLMEAVERLIAEGYQPKRTIYLAFGHDEEIGGHLGAETMAGLLKSRGVQAAFVLDEGGVMKDGIIPNKTLALIGIAEKGYLTLDLEATGPGGHSSMPPNDMAIDQLVTAIAKIRSTSFPARITESSETMIRYIGPELPMIPKMIMANTFLTESLVKKEYAKTSAGFAVFHTTIAPTILNAGVKDNVIATIAKASINFRILPGDTRESVTKHIAELVNNPNIKITPRVGSSADPSTTSSVETFGFKTIHKTIKEFNPELLVTPYLTVGQTDARHYASVTENTYRYIPARIWGFHDVDERISVMDFKAAVAFYYQLIKNVDAELIN